MPGFLSCLLGPEIGPPAPACDRHDFNRDGVIDMADVQAFQRTVTRWP